MRLKKLESVNCLYVVATMTPPEVNLDATQLRQIHRYEGYTDIAVHYVIDRNGKMHEGRSREYPGALAPKTRSMNSYQIALVGGRGPGGVPEDNFTPQQKVTLGRMKESFGFEFIFDPHSPLKSL